MNTERVTAVLRAAIQQNLLGQNAPAALFYDLDEFRGTIGRIRGTFPITALHTIAVKANPLAQMLREAHKVGMGAECASLPELQHALRLGFSPMEIVFDSPAKTQAELQFSLDHGVYLNIDNFQELERVAKIACSTGKPVRAGIRINPQTGAGSYVGTSTAVATSKFGVPLGEERARILTAFDSFPWLIGLHVHTGSQVCPLDLVVRGVSTIVDLADEIGKRREVPVQVIDIGGGLPANYVDDTHGTHLSDYVALLQARVPGLSKYRIVTEFGRTISAKSGWAASLVEYTKCSGGRQIAVIHLGTDFMVRTAYVPDVWKHRVTAHEANGEMKVGMDVLQDVAGPLCFAGDLVAKERGLPLLRPGDLIVIHDVGAYTLSMWSRYNSRQAPAVYAYETVGNDLKLTLLKPAETVDEVLRFWGA